MKAQKDADAQVQKILSQAKSQADDLIARADSAAQLQRRRLLLETKQELITSVIEQAKQSILDLPDSEYFDLILKLISSNASNITPIATPLPPKGIARPI